MIHFKKRVFKYAFWWLLFLAPFFYISYGFANLIADNYLGIGEIYYQWEKAIPFLAWTIIPYWCLNIFYGLSLFIQKNKGGVSRLAGRYLTAQLIAVACFILFPLKISFIKPETVGLFGQLFDHLAAFDKPYNQAPSLHIALLTIVWDLWRKRLTGIWLVLWHIFCALIAISVLTTYQHHFIDIPTGFLLGVFCLWLFPEKGALPFSNFKRIDNLRQKNIALIYFGLSLICGNIAYWLFADGWGLLALWPMVCFALLGYGYVGAGVKVFQKSQDGNVSFASLVIFAPFRLCALINSRLWTRNIAPYNEIAGNIYLGRFPSFKQVKRFSKIIDLTGEFQKPMGAKHWYSFPMLDLVEPDIKIASKAVAAIGDNPQEPVLVCCALGMQRSAVVLGKYLCEKKYTDDMASAKILLQKHRPVVFEINERRDSGFSFAAAAFYCFFNIILVALFIWPLYDYVVNYTYVFDQLYGMEFFLLLMIYGYAFFLILRLVFDAWFFFKQRHAATIAEGLQNIDRVLLRAALRAAPPSNDVTQRMNNIYLMTKSLWVSVSIGFIGIAGLMFYRSLIKAFLWLM
ncbi:phosphatase PAP2/dual specificity phosphatase family protein [Bartonella sp. HY038]|uniref:phosphatase PAP2/dual specificity phosphatase family protein n=1 Tax=Bartonella sp. HY038 TaxID=2759660 RepID=UPI0015FA5202|nr:phosphatase PAP2/dual specificity phosphatase family protein [Bartonella sp. HY038]